MWYIVDVTLSLRNDDILNKLLDNTQIKRKVYIIYNLRDRFDPIAQQNVRVRQE